MCNFVEICFSSEYFLYLCNCIVSAAHVVVTVGWLKKMRCKNLLAKLIVSTI